MAPKINSSLADYNPSYILDACFTSEALSSPLCRMITRTPSGPSAGQISQIEAPDQNIGAIVHDRSELTRYNRTVAALRDVRRALIGGTPMTEETSFTPLTGGCKCGKVRFRLEAPPIITHCCHCRDCQKNSGSAFSINAMIETRHLNVFEGHAEAFQQNHTDREVRCPACEFTLWSYHRLFGEAIAFVGVGNLDEGERLEPEAHYFTRSKHPWVVLPTHVPSFAELGNANKAGTRERIAAAMANR